MTRVYTLLACCKRGHAFTKENTYITTRGDGRIHRRCRACMQMIQKLRYPGVHGKDKTHCPQGHPYSKENTAIRTVRGKFQSRTCKICDRKNHRRNHLRDKYGITLTQYSALFDHQRGLCRICKRRLRRDHSSPREDGVRACIEHNHKTQRVRGLTCNYCNSTLMRLWDSTEKAQAFVDYLKNDGDDIAHLMNEDLVS